MQPTRGIEVTSFRRSNCEDPGAPGERSSSLRTRGTSFVAVRDFPSSIFPFANDTLGGLSLRSRSVTISEWKGYVRVCRENRGLQFGRPLLGSRSGTRGSLAARRKPSSRRSVTGSSRIRIGGRTPSKPTSRGASNITRGSARPLVAGERLIRLMRPRSIIC